MDEYIIFGTINTLFIFVSLLGILSQLRSIWVRKDNALTVKASTELLSLNQFVVSFMAYFSFFVYGYSITPFNHFIVWPRLIATLLIAAILFEIWQDRRNTSATLSLFSAALILVIGLIGFLIGPEISDQSQLISTSLILIVTLFIAQGYYHQIMLIIRSRSTGAVDIKMSQFILMMDFSTIAFAFAMGLENGWPLLVLATVSGITKLIIMYLFRWVRLQPKKLEAT